jgi:hypothetical protein
MGRRSWRCRPHTHQHTTGAGVRVGAAVQAAWPHVGRTHTSLVATTCPGVSTAVIHCPEYDVECVVSSGSQGNLAV